MPLENSHLKWNANRFLTDENLWKNAQSTFISTFFEKYTLHDSNWLDFGLEPWTQAAVAVIEWDTFWSKNQVPYPPCPVLFLFFKETYQVSFCSGDKTSINTIAETTSRLISEKERETLMDLALNLRSGEQLAKMHLHDNLHQTIIKDIVGGQTHLFHAPEILVLCLDSETGEFINLTKI